MEIEAIVSMFFIFLATVAAVGMAIVGNNKKSRKNALSWAFIITGIIIFVIMISYIGLGYAVRVHDSSTSSSSVADGFTIDGYKVDLTVNEDNKVDVRETLMINFYEGGHHGIFRFIPYWLPYTTKDGKTTSRKANITDVTVRDYNFITEEVNDKLRIKIGSAYLTLDRGIYTYVIHYIYDMGGDPYKGFDEFIFHAFGDYWGTSIHNAEITINMPKEFDSKDIKFFADKERKEDITEYIDYSISGKVIILKVKDTYSLRSALTVDIPLEEGYFTEGSNNYGLKSLALCLFVIALGWITYLLWKKHGKNYIRVQTVEFYPPEGLDPSEVGIINKGCYGSRLNVALLISLASKKYIKIDEVKEKETDTNGKIIITNNVPISISTAFNRVIKATVIKKFPKILLFPDNEKKSAKIYYEKYFGKETEITIDRDFVTFVAEMNYLVKHGYVKYTDSLYEHSQEEIDKKAQELKDNKELLFSELPELSINEEALWNKLFEERDVLDLSVDTFPTLSYSTFANSKEKIYDKIYDISSYKYKILTSLLFIVAVISFALSYCFIQDLNPALKFIYYIAFASLIPIFIFTILMGRKSTYGEELTAKIEGFKHYLEVAEKEQLDRITSENKHYFYDIIPYAYVLGVSKAWIDKFQGYTFVDNDLYLFDDYSLFSTIETSCYHSLITHSSSCSSCGSSGCSSCGGGCSSCGGGCSSCGGGGSW